jgi:hypothetical protein
MPNALQGFFHQFAIYNKKINPDKLIIGVYFVVEKSYAAIASALTNFDNFDF